MSIHLASEGNFKDSAWPRILIFASLENALIMVKAFFLSVIFFFWGNLN
jgi:hypothetical protein